MKIKRCIVLIICVCLLQAVSFSFADSILLCEDSVGEFSVHYNESDSDSPMYYFSWCLPRLDGSDEFSNAVNSYYSDQIIYQQDFDVPCIADSFYGITDEDSHLSWAYELHCNNGDYLSFLIIKTEFSQGHQSVTYTGNTFSQSNIKPGSTVALPYLLGILDNEDSDDTWLENRQTEKADEIVRELILDEIQNPDSNIPYYSDSAYDIIQYCFFPEEDFYMNESGNPVFFIQPGFIAPEEYGLMIFEVDLEDILDEM